MSSSVGTFETPLKTGKIRKEDLKLSSWDNQRATPSPKLSADAAGGHGAGCANSDASKQPLVTPPKSSTKNKKRTRSETPGRVITSSSSIKAKDSTKSQSAEKDAKKSRAYDKPDEQRPNSYGPPQSNGLRWFCFSIGFCILMPAFMMLSIGGGVFIGNQVGLFETSLDSLVNIWHEKIHEAKLKLEELKKARESAALEAKMQVAILAAKALEVTANTTVTSVDGISTIFDHASAIDDDVATIVDDAATSIGDIDASSINLDDVVAVSEPKTLAEPTHSCGNGQGQNPMTSIDVIANPFMPPQVPDLFTFQLNDIQKQMMDFESMVASFFADPEFEAAFAQAYENLAVSSENYNATAGSGMVEPASLVNMPTQKGDDVMPERKATQQTSTGDAPPLSTTKPDMKALSEDVVFDDRVLYAAEEDADGNEMYTVRLMPEDEIVGQDVMGDAKEIPMTPLATATHPAARVDQPVEPTVKQRTELAVEPSEFELPMKQVEESAIDRFETESASVQSEQHEIVPQSRRNPLRMDLSSPLDWKLLNAHVIPWDAMECYWNTTPEAKSAQSLVGWFFDGLMRNPVDRMIDYYFRSPPRCSSRGIGQDPLTNFVESYGSFYLSDIKLVKSAPVSVVLTNKGQSKLDGIRPSGTNCSNPYIPTGLNAYIVVKLGVSVKATGFSIGLRNVPTSNFFEQVRVLGNRNVFLGTTLATETGGSNSEIRYNNIGYPNNVYHVPSKKPDEKLESLTFQLKTQASTVSVCWVQVFGEVLEE